MKGARKKNPLKVFEMKRDDFIDNLKGALFSNLSKPVDIQGEKFNWILIHEFVYEKGLFGFRFKYDVNGVQRTCYLGPKSKARNSGRPKEATFTECPLTHPNGVKLKPAKIKDVKVLLKYIPEVHHQFYLDLEADDTIDDSSDEDSD